MQYFSTKKYYKFKGAKLTRSTSAYALPLFLLHPETSGQNWRPKDFELCLKKAFYNGFLELHYDVFLWCYNSVFLNYAIQYCFEF